MSNLKDLTGMKFGRLTVIERVENKGKRACWKCRCDCGNDVIVDASALNHNLTTSCGCQKRERIIKYSTKHGMCGTKIYRTWQNMLARCLEKGNRAYKHYGGRGISVYPAWINNFQAFYDYVSQLEHYGEEGYTLDRIDNNGNYEPNNLRWADRKTQTRNQRSNHIVEYKGESMTLAEAAEKSGIYRATLFARIKNGDTGERLFRPVKKLSIKKSLR